MTITDRKAGLKTGLGMKAPVVVASTANLTLSSTQVVDGIAVGTNQRVLVKDQTDDKENGIWVAGPTAWTRAKDFDGDEDAVAGTAVWVDRGTAGGGKFYAVNSSSLTYKVTIPTAQSTGIVWSLVQVELTGVSGFSQNTLFPLATASAWRSTDGLSAAPDPFGSTSVSSSAIVTAGIASSAVTTAKIADSNVTLAKMSTGTEGTIVAYSSLGSFGEVAVGSSGHVLTSQGVGVPPVMQAAIETETEQATTSGTAFDFTSISANVKRITVSLDAVSLDAAQNLLVQIGDSGGIESSGYTSASIFTENAAAVVGITDTSGFIMRLASTSREWTGHMTLTKMSGDKWIASHNGSAGGMQGIHGGGSKTLSATLDRIRLTRVVAGNFDNGAVNILVE